MTQSSIEERLRELGIELPAASEPAAKYANFVEAAGLLFVSGKGPSGSPRGKLGRDFTVEDGYRFARSAGIEVLAVVRSAIGTLDRVKRVVKLQGFVNADPGFEQPHLVLNGFSDLVLEVFGEPRGSHARSVLGASTLRNQLPIVVDSIFQVE
ncbi:RidA family protein [Cohnella lubricantis]|uniref:RidA family protein n=1 Tax=Cohnella lubricantis TaxID=2163172 RepID=A0A841T6U5_9BACL|nr:RidA family protein [Cohnella lubricantis]MBB6677054.1 RidA family protein [Cohnella lubricantis]MBP2118901.1 enamine deaminase RidA (YjgF/YER057c/UK114 family) [Cohnella lubricantis]